LVRTAVHAPRTPARLQAPSLHTARMNPTPQKLQELLQQARVIEHTSVTSSISAKLTRALRNAVWLFRRSKGMRTLF
jgi:hypothetical protein